MVSYVISSRGSCRGESVNERPRSPMIYTYLDRESFLLLFAQGIQE